MSIFFRWAKRDEHFSLDEHSRWVLSLRWASQMGTFFSDGHARWGRDEHFLSNEQARWALFVQMSNPDEHIFYRWATQMSTFFQMRRQNEHFFQIKDDWKFCLPNILDNFAPRPTPKKVQKGQRIGYNLKNVQKHASVSDTLLKKNYFKIKIVPPQWHVNGMRRLLRLSANKILLEHYNWSSRRDELALFHVRIWLSRCALFLEMSKTDEHFVNRWANQMSTKFQMSQMSTFFQMSIPDEHLFLRWANLDEHLLFSDEHFLFWDEHLSPLWGICVILKIVDFNSLNIVTVKTNAFFTMDLLMVMILEYIVLETEICVFPIF